MNNKLLYEKPQLQALEIEFSGTIAQSVTSPDGKGGDYEWDIFE